MNRRVAALVAVCLGIGVPAAALRVACFGRACVAAEATSDLPFCSLPGRLRDGLADGFYEGRSPDVLTVTGGASVAGGTAWPASGGPGWPATDVPRPDRVPLVFAGPGIEAAAVPAGTRLDAVAPTIARLLGLRRPHPEVRSGTPVPGVQAPAVPRLVLLLVWKGTDAAALERGAGSTPWLEGLLRRGAGTLEASVGSLPADPAAVLTTIGTGGLPRQHGVTGSFVKGTDGRAVPAWSARAPLSVIATLGDDLDQQMDQEPRVGLVATAAADRGLIGGNWYLDVDRDDLVLEPGGPAPSAAAAVQLARTRDYGRDGVPDVLAVALEGPPERLDRASRAVAASLQRITRGSTLVVVVGSGGSPAPDAVDARTLERKLESDLGARAVEALTPGGFFLDQRTLARRKLAQDEILDAIARLESDDGAPVFDEVFPDLAVTFGRYC